MTFDPRSYSTPVVEQLTAIRKQYDDSLESKAIDSKLHSKHLKEQKSQAQELYSFLSTWGLLRLKGEELALNKWEGKDFNQQTLKARASKEQEGKREVVEAFFSCLEIVSGERNLTGQAGVVTLTQRHTNMDKYLGLMGIALELAQEFSFWANALYFDITAQGGNDA